MHIPDRNGSTCTHSPQDSAGLELHRRPFKNVNLFLRSPLVRDRDGIYGYDFTTRVDGMGIRQVPISARSPWQNCHAERMIGSIRRECLNHVIVINEAFATNSKKLLKLLQPRFILPYLTMCLKNRSSLVERLVLWVCVGRGRAQRVAPPLQFAEHAG